MNKHEKVLFGLALCIFFLFGTFIICTIANAAELNITMKNNVITMPLSTFKFMAGTIQKQQKEIKDDEDIISSLNETLRDLESCVREAAMNSEPTLKCFNRTQFRNPDHKHPTVDGD